MNINTHCPRCAIPWIKPLYTFPGCLCGIRVSGTSNENVIQLALEFPPYTAYWHIDRDDPDSFSLALQNHQTSVLIQSDYTSFQSTLEQLNFYQTFS